MKKKIPKLSGVAARQWRRHLAASADRYDDTTRTLKFPLENALVSWEQARDLHRVIASDADGSLINFLYTLLLAGFRVFGKQSTTEAFRNEATLGDADWLSTMKESSLTIARDSFVPSRIYERILISPRAVGGKNNAFDPTVVAREYAKTFCMRKSGEKIPEVERAFFDAIGSALCAGFDSWQSVSADPVTAAEIIERVMHEHGIPLPRRSLKARIKGLRTFEPNGTVGFDPNSTPILDYVGIEANLILARALAAGRNAGLTEKKELIVFSQAFFTGDANHGGLAWLFGRGLVDYFQTVSLQRCMDDFGIPDSRRDSVEKVLNAAKAIPPAESSFLGGKNYSGYRNGIGGLLGSWIANTYSRLSDLNAVLAAKADPLQLPQALLGDEQIFVEIGIMPHELTALAYTALSRRDVARASLDRLMGIAPGATKEDIEAVEACNVLLDTLAGQLSSLKERVKKSLETATALQDEQVVAHLKTYEFTVPDWISRMDKLNRLNIAPISPEAILESAIDDFNILQDAMHVHYGRIHAWAKTKHVTLSPLDRLAAREEKYAASKKRNPKEHALRACLDTIGRGSRKCSEDTLKRVVEFFKAQDIFTERSHLNQYFFNRRGSLYKSAFDKNRRSPFEIKRDAINRGANILNEYADFLADFRKEVMSEEKLTFRKTSDLYRLEQSYFAVLLMGFPDEIPSHLALPEIAADIFNLPLPIALRLSGDHVSSSVMRRIFNNYYIQLERLVALLLRDKFFMRAKFQRAGDNALLYVPASDAHWNPPARLYHSKKPIGEVMRWMENVNAGTDPIDVPKAIATYSQHTSEGLNSPPMRDWLRQAPHDWHFPWTGSTEVNGVSYNKTVGFNKRMVTVEASRLIGVSHYKGVLDSMITSPDRVSTGDVAILVNQYFKQDVRREESGRLIIKVTPINAVVELALPIAFVKPQLESPAFTFSRYVGIDLGERGFGYAVFDTATHELIDKGFIKVKSMHRLVMEDRIGKRRRMSANKFRAPYDPAEELRRKNVIGDYCNAINSVMRYYDAFPVMEYVAGGASKAIDKIYDGVLARYLYSTTASVNRVRTNFWEGASYWKHATLKQFKFDAAVGAKSKAVVPLTLFPGTAESAAGTSQTCSCCGRNPIEMVRAMQAEHKASGKKGDVILQIEEGGIIKLPTGTIRLRTSASGDEREAFRSRNQRTPLSQSLGAGMIVADELFKFLYSNLRQAPASRQKHDTTISRYQCIFTDCGHTEHADINAAINLGKKFAQKRPTVV